MILFLLSVWCASEVFGMPTQVFSYQIFKCSNSIRNNHNKSCPHEDARRSLQSSKVSVKFYEESKYHPQKKLLFYSNENWTDSCTSQAVVRESIHVFSSTLTAATLLRPPTDKKVSGLKCSVATNWELMTPGKLLKGQPIHDVKETSYGRFCTFPSSWEQVTKSTRPTQNRVRNSLGKLVSWIYKEWKIFTTTGFRQTRTAQSAIRWHRLFLKPLIWTQKTTLEKSRPAGLAGWCSGCWLEVSITRGTSASRAPGKRHSHYNWEELNFFIYAKCVISYHIVF